MYIFKMCISVNNLLVEWMTLMKWANLLWIVLMVMAPVQHALTTKILSSSTDLKYQIKYLNILFDHSKCLQN